MWKTTCDVYALGIREGLRKAGDILLEDLYNLPKSPGPEITALIEALANMLHEEGDK